MLFIFIKQYIFQIANFFWEFLSVLLGIKSLGSGLGDSSFGHFSSLVGFIKLVLDLSESRHGGRSGLSCVLGGLLVRFNFGVELIDAVRKSDEVLLVLIVGVVGLFVLSLELSHDLGVVWSCLVSSSISISRHLVSSSWTAFLRVFKNA